MVFRMVTLYLHNCTLHITNIYNVYQRLVTIEMHNDKLKFIGK